MNRKQQLWLFVILAVTCAALMTLLVARAPTLDGHALSQSALQVPLSQLQQHEHAPLRAWLVMDVFFAAVYTILLTWGLRWLAGRAPSSLLAITGRTLSWFTAVGVVFDVLENLILWTAAAIGATRVSPWLPVLAKLKWLPPGIFVAYAAAWLAQRYWMRVPDPAESSPS